MKTPRSTKRTRGRVALGIALLLSFGTVATSEAHFLVSRRSLRDLIAESDLVVHARVIEAERLERVEGGEGWKRRPPSIRVLGSIKGPARKGERLSFAQHGHGSAELQAGQEAVFFLRRIEKSRELAPFAESSQLRWYSDQEHVDDWLLSADSRKPVLAASYRYAAIEEMLPAQRDAALRKITVNLLASKDARLAKSALQDLVSLRDAPLVSAADLPRLVPVIQSENAPIELRVGLLTELERRGLFDGEQTWVYLLRTSRGSDRLAVIPPAGTRLRPAIQQELVAILEGPDLDAASASAVALGVPGNRQAVVPLSQALRSENRRLATSAIRALGRIGTPEARSAIESAAASHPDSGVRRRAEAELRLMQSRSERR